MAEVAQSKSRSHALGIEVVGASKSFGAFRALDRVSIKVAPGTIHALLGENGAGKSTLVKGLVGYGLLDEGQIVANGREVRIASPRDAQTLGIGMVYQHFTLASGLSVEENLLLARGGLPWKIDWRAERAALTAFMAQMPFRLPLERASFTDAEVVRSEDGALAIMAAAPPQAGNWLPLPPEGRFQFRLRLYDTPVSGQTGETRATNLPQITRVDCR